MPADLVVHVGRADGVGGRVSGHTLLADGTVRRFEGRAPGDGVAVEGRVTLATVRALWEQIENVGVRSMQRQDVASPAYFVSVRADGETRHVQWHVPLGQAPEPTPLQRLYDDLRTEATAALDV